MYIDLLSRDATGEFNIKFAKATNLQTAVYTSCLLVVLSRVYEKKTYDEAGYFKVQRKYISEKTTLTPSQQKECDKILVSLGIIDISADSADIISFNAKKYYEIILDSNKTETKQMSATIKQVSKEEKAESKRLGIIHRLQNGLDEQDQEIKTAYCNWIEVAYDKGIVRKPQVDLFVGAIRNYSSRKDVQLSIINLATLFGYREASWVIKMYEKDHKKGSTAQLGEQKKFTGFSEQTF